MSKGEAIYLTMVMVAFVAFMVTLAWVERNWKH